tara:strand:- start:764 stop:2596 length:1833 start_codon:yes stop_codon:yes gene_type:complete
MKQWTTTQDFINNGKIPSSATAGFIVQTEGFNNKGDGGGASWKFTGVTGQAPSQTPAQLGDVKLTDASGNEWCLVINGAVFVESLGFVGVGDETKTIAAAFAGVPSGATVTCQKKYAFTSGVHFINDKSMTIDLKGSDVTTLSGNSFIWAEGSYSKQQSVVSLTETTVTVTDGSVYSVGDVFKITSEDEHRDFWVAGRFLGQFAIITDVSGNVLTLDRDIIDWDYYLTNIICGVLNDYRVDIKNVNISPEVSASDHPALITQLNLMKPKLVNINVSKTKDAGMLQASCYLPLNANCSGRDLLDSSGTNNFGYAVELSSCEGAIIYGLRVNKCRHAYTNNAASSSTGANLRCGYQTNTIVINGICHNATSGGWDTHPGAINTRFIDCQAFNCDNFGQVRARETKFINPYGRGNSRAILATTGKNPSTVNPVSGMLIQGADIDSQGTLVEYYLQSGTTIADTDVATITIRGGFYSARNGGYRGWLVESRANPMVLTIEGLRAFVSALNTDLMVLMAEKAGNITNLRNLEINVTSSPLSAAGFKLARPLGDITVFNNEAYIENITFKGAGLVNNSIIVAELMDAYINNVRSTDLGTGVMTDIVAGTRQTWVSV